MGVKIVSGTRTVGNLSIQKAIPQSPLEHVSFLSYYIYVSLGLHPNFRRIFAGLMLLLTLFIGGHLFFVSLSLDTGSGLATADHHSGATHEGKDSHVSCPNDIHQLSNQRNEGSDLSFSYITLPANPLCFGERPSILSYANPLAEKEVPPLLPLDQKTILLI